jgi:hypothetical protein
MTRRTVWLVITSLVVGPALGGLIFMVAAILADAAATPANSRPIFMSIDTYWPIVVTASYLLGAAPALLSAIGMAIATRWLPAMWQRLLVAPVIAALISIAILNVVLLGNGHGTIDDWMVTGVIALSGAIAGFACLAIVELFHPYPPPEKAAT